MISQLLSVKSRDLTPSQVNTPLVLAALWVQLVSLKVDLSLDGVRRDERFKELMTRVGIP